MKDVLKQSKKYLSTYMKKVIFIKDQESSTGVRYVRHRISDAEVEHEDQARAFLAYQISDCWKRTVIHVEIATTRPETLLGDTAVAVHPDDERYTAY